MMIYRILTALIIVLFGSSVVHSQIDINSVEELIKVLSDTSIHPIRTLEDIKTFKSDTTLSNLDKKFYRYHIRKFIQDSVHLEKEAKRIFYGEQEKEKVPIRIDCTEQDTGFIDCLEKKIADGNQWITTYEYDSLRTLVLEEDYEAIKHCCYNLSSFIEDRSEFEFEGQDWYAPIGILLEAIHKNPRVQFLILYHLAEKDFPIEEINDDFYLVFYENIEPVMNILYNYSQWNNQKFADRFKLYYEIIKKEHIHDK